MRLLTINLISHHREGTLDVTGCELAFDDPIDGAWASDHFGVVADLQPVPYSDDPR